jgi:hypothetical protein
VLLVVQEGRDLCLGSGEVSSKKRQNPPNKKTIEGKFKKAIEEKAKKTIEGKLKKAIKEKAKKA